MAGGWQAVSTTPGVRQGSVSLQVGDARTWNLAVPGKDLTGYSAQWLLGVPPNPAMLGLLSTSYTPPDISVMKTTGANLNIVVTGSGASLVSNLRFALTYADTIDLTPRTYWQQAVAIDPMGNPYTVAEGPVNLTPSLRALQFSTGPIPLSNPALISFGIWQGDSTPPQTWGFQNPDGSLIDLTGSTFALTVMNGATLLISALSSDGSGALTVNLATSTVSWNYTSAQSLMILTSGATYQLHRMIGGTTQLWAHGSLVGLTP
ncbi:hypothetical protein MKK88_01035 [Methylobacterium sp. E-005]|uniref:hypothetical protein n=1 Tax=Methylobacterium sp. E-005 TaxID=2836549 RepID=UPI001FBB4BCD|nr:hypothetical protein [Methylobacterium sp. E-005]MCJ2084580.1 hypothetical protein [Methylobacterium sp. E-005]